MFAYASTSKYTVAYASMLGKSPCMPAYDELSKQMGHVKHMLEYVALRHICYQEIGYCIFGSTTSCYRVQADAKSCQHVLAHNTFCELTIADGWTHAGSRELYLPIPSDFVVD